MLINERQWLVLKKLQQLRFGCFSKNRVTPSLQNSNIVPKDSHVATRS
jgi:hypothetical protein